MENKMKNFFNIVLFGLIFLTFQTHAENYVVTVPEEELIGQFHGNPVDADLRIYMAGNQFVIMDLLVEAFQQQHPEVENIFYVTIPPGQELNWILGGAIEIKSENSLANDGFVLNVMPDVYSTVNKGHMDQLANAGYITRFYTYAHNRLVLMVKDDDPLAGSTLDASGTYNLLSDPSVTISEPDIITQGIERHIWQMYTDISKVVFPYDMDIQNLIGTMFNPGALSSDPVNSLRRIVYHDKALTGDTFITSVHHIETPAYIRSGEARLGPVWITEILYQQNRLGATDISHIEIDGFGPDGKYLDRREKVNYLATIVEGEVEPPNKQAALDWMEFLRGPVAQGIFETAGFIPGSPEELSMPVIYPNSKPNSKTGNY